MNLGIKKQKRKRLGNIVGRNIFTACFSCLFLFYFSFSSNAQIEFNGTYETEYLEAEFEKAKLRKDSFTMGIAALKLSGNLTWFQGKTVKSLDLLTFSLACFAAVGDSMHYYTVLTNIATEYYNIKLFDQAEKTLLIIYDYYNRHDDNKMKLHISDRLAVLYNATGDQDKYSFYTQQAKMLNEVVKDTLLDIIFLIRLTYEYRKAGKLDSALLMAKQGLALSIRLDKWNFIANNRFIIGITEQDKGNTDTAIVYLKQAMKKYQNLEYSTLRRQCYLHLSRCFAMQLNYEAAYNYMKRYAVLNDSILDKDRNEALDRLTLDFESKQKQAEIEGLEKENRESKAQSRQKSFLLVGLSFLLLLLFAMLGLIVRFYKDKIKQGKIINNQSEILQKQKIQSLENTIQLTSVKSMLEGQEKERTRISQDLHDSVGGLLSTIKLQLSNISKEKRFNKIGVLLDKTAKEVRSIAHNLQPSALEQLGLVAAIKDLINLYQNQPIEINFQYYNVPKVFNTGTALHLYRIIQESLHNALKHSAASEILIQINGERQGVSILIEDNGQGFDTTDFKTGGGLTNIQKRVEYLGAELTLESNENGSTVFLYLTLEEEK